MILNERYFKMCNAIFSYELTPIQYAVYSYLVSLSGANEKCWPSMKRIAACCHCSKNAARAAVDELERRGFIRKIHSYRENKYGNNRQTNNTYFILDMPDLYTQGVQHMGVHQMVGKCITKTQPTINKPLSRPCSSRVRFSCRSKP